MQRKLNECEIGGRYVVAGVQVDEGITRRLEALGVNEGCLLYTSDAADE